jgi:hypothetical protein
MYTKPQQILIHPNAQTYNNNPQVQVQQNPQVQVQQNPQVQVQQNKPSMHSLLQ